MEVVRILEVITGKEFEIQAVAVEVIKPLGEYLAEVTED